MDEMITVTARADGARIGIDDACNEKINVHRQEVAPSLLQQRDAPSQQRDTLFQQKQHAAEMMTCTRCGEYLPRSKLERLRTGTYRRVCNHCKWLYYVKPARYRRILRELEERRNSKRTA